MLPEKTVTDRWDVAQKHHKGFWKYWKKTESEERKRMYKEYWQHYLKFLYEFTPLREDSKILEIGCGIDGIINYIEKGEKYAVDSLMDYFLSEFDMGKDTKWIKGVGENLPFDSNYFDVVITTNTLDHTMNPQRVMIEINRALKKGGTLLLSVDVYSPFVKHYRRLREFFGVGDEPHPHAFSVKDVTKLAEKSGFKVLKIHEGIGDFGAYTHRRLSGIKDQKLTSQATPGEGYYERGLRVLKEKGILAFVHAIFDNLYFLGKDKLRKMRNKLRNIINKKINAYSELDFIFIISK